MTGSDFGTIVKATVYGDEQSPISLSKTLSLFEGKRFFCV